MARAYKFSVTHILQRMIFAHAFARIIAKEHASNYMNHVKIILWNASYLTRNIQENQRKSYKNYVISLTRIIRKLMNNTRKLMILTNGSSLDPFHNLFCSFYTYSYSTNYYKQQNVDQPFLLFSIAMDFCPWVKRLSK